MGAGLREEERERREQADQLRRAVQAGGGERRERLADAEAGEAQRLKGAAERAKEERKRSPGG